MEGSQTKSVCVSVFIADSLLNDLKSISENTLTGFRGGGCKFGSSAFGSRRVQGETRDLHAHGPLKCSFSLGVSGALAIYTNNLSVI